ncbi:sigma-70 family RNA polymerase sigma factor [Herbaspirillum autotrophicum]|uniref:sigma-70 family RNA polymerase sigma factor n=1 Tax=Herbaspirillum autotrophicum TaxID=180195 RepID=UPI00067C6DC2|nr:sigma-70 family RNA polymerase sigma factor [Herbaspirillum autotrophicum]
MVDALNPADISEDDDATPVAGAALENEDAIWRAWRVDKDAASREQLVQHYLPYARIVAASYYRRRFHDEIEFAEYLQLASVGLLESIDRFDPTIGVHFKTFSARRIHGAILSGIETITEKQQQIALRKQLQAERRDSLKRREVSADSKTDKPEDLFRRLADVGIGLALAYLLEGTGMVDVPEEAADQNQYYRQIELRQLQQRVRGLVDELTVQERTVIRYHYLQEVPFSEIATLLGLTKGRIAQIHKQALGRLRTALQSKDRLDLAL